MMDTAFYHDDDHEDVLIGSPAQRAPSYHHHYHHHHSSSSMMKKELSLNLNEPTSATMKPPPHLRGDADGILHSPDLGLFKLASPELERLIIQSNGMVTTTPSAQFLFPKSGSDEQDFAEGFVKALEDLHKQNQLGTQSGGGGGGGGVAAGGGAAGLELNGNPPAPVSLHSGELPPVYTNLSSFGAAAVTTTTVNYSTDTVPFPPPPPGHLRLQALKDEPQTVPDVQSFGESPPLSPIDMDTQERIKAERKKLRNRIAASKCRKRKLERISRLEDKVKSLKNQNTELASTASLLREQVAQLKQKVLNHVNSGCQLLPQQVQAY
ncbi:transcription factor jun-D [Polypterus senegalus]